MMSNWRLSARRFCCGWLLCGWLAPVLACAADPVAETDPGNRFFRTRIEPVLKRECYACHSAHADELQGGLRLDSLPGLQRGGDSGSLIDKDRPEKSLLIQALRHENGVEMPPDKQPLAARIVSDFVRWIELGAPDPRAVEPDLPMRSNPREHWAFQPIRTPALPAVKQDAWIRNPIDAFVLARLEERGWAPAPEASRTAWIRRATFDLTGLPPTPEEIRAFVDDESPLAYERVVDRLLESPHYGERQAMHWLDVIRYAETEGYEYDAHLPDAWRFRDYVIASMNGDKPFDRFVLEQLAGDELDPENLEFQTAAVFHRLGPVRRNAGNPDIALSRNEVLTERTDIIGTAFLGLTVGCARCHNHKLEPILQKDYYRLQAYLAATDEHNISLAAAPAFEKWESETAKVKAELKKLREAAQQATGAAKDKLEQQVEELEATLPPHLPTIPGVHNDMSRRTAIHILKRGVWEDKGDAVGPRPLSILVPDELPELPPDAPQPRTQLAKWLVSDDNSLTARVIVNRLWQGHFGNGIVRTPNDFGLRGDSPSHPELLDWLATQLREGGWRLKPLHRLMVLSGAYRQGSGVSTAATGREQDPDNRLLWHMPRRRLTAEELRDAMLSASGRLNRKAGGPSVMLPVDPELVQLLYKPSQWQTPADPQENGRRSIYLIAKRNLRLPFLETFDAPALLSSCARREASTHAPQALELLNGAISNELARSFADRLRKEFPDNSAQQIKRAFELAIGRLPNPRERDRSAQFLADQPLEEFTLALFNLNEFVYVP